MTIVIAGQKRSGKTTALIEIAAERGGYIVCYSIREANRIFARAKDMGCNIHLPLTYAEFKAGTYHGAGIGEVYIDNLDMLAQYLAAGRVYAATVTVKEE